MHGLKPKRLWAQYMNADIAMLASGIPALLPVILTELLGHPFGRAGSTVY